jgi:histone deacetylase 1/2
MASQRRISYFYDAEIGNYHYGQGHPMKVSGLELSPACRGPRGQQ